MIYEVILAEEAEWDVDEGILWYEEQQTGLGLRFYYCLLERLETIKLNPQYYFNIQEGCRRIIIEPFPYSIIYKLYDPIILVLAVFHHGRNPSELIRRLK